MPSKHQNALALTLRRLIGENKTLQQVKSKSTEEEAINKDAQKLNAKVETDAVKV